jgi:hypothetical protein
MRTAKPIALLVGTLLLIGLVGCESPSERRRKEGVLKQARAEELATHPLVYPTGKGPGEYLRIPMDVLVYQVVLAGDPGTKGYSQWVIKPEKQDSVMRWKGVDRIVRGQLLYTDWKVFDFHDGPGVDAKIDNPDPRWKETTLSGIRFWLDDESRGAKIVLFFSSELH